VAFALAHSLVFLSRVLIGKKKKEKSLQKAEIYSLFLVPHLGPLSYSGADWWF